MLEAIARKRLVKTTAGYKRLSWYCGDLRIVDIGGVVVIIVPNRVYKWSPIQTQSGVSQNHITNT
jgi:hypothetical protein